MGLGGGGGTWANLVSDLVKVLSCKNVPAYILYSLKCVRNDFFTRNARFIYRTRNMKHAWH